MSGVVWGRGEGEGGGGRGGRGALELIDFDEYITTAGFYFAKTYVIIWDKKGYTLRKHSLRKTHYNGYLI